MAESLYLQHKPQAMPVLRLVSRPALLLLAALLLGCGGSSGAGKASDPPAISITPPQTPSTVITTPAPPSAPLISSVVAGDGSISIAFGKPLSDGGSPITSYTARCDPGAGTAAVRSAASSPIVVIGLTNASSYSCNVTASNSAGTGTVSETISATPVALLTSAAFRGNVILGNPTNTSIAANIFAPDQNGTVWLVYGSTSGNYSSKTASFALVASKPVEIPVTGLLANTRCYVPI